MPARVNQKLYYARLALDAASQTEERVPRLALTEASVFHLAIAYRAYLREIAFVHRYDIYAEDAQDAQRQWQAEQRNSPELNELVALESSGAWPAQLAAAYRAASALELPQSATAVSAIAVADVTAEADINDCRRWLDAFQELLERQRERLHES